MAGYGEQTEKIGGVSRVSFSVDPYDRIKAYTNNVGSTYKPSAEEIAMTKNVAINDGYMARCNIFAFGTEGLNMLGPNGTHVCQNQYDEFGNLHQRTFSIVA